MGNSSQKSWIDRARDRVQASKYLDLLERFIYGENDPKTQKPQELSTDQLRAVLSLLDRVLPKLSQQTVQVEDKRKEVRTMSLEELISEWDEGRTDIRPTGAGPETLQ
jgi:hypothetical protein